jgi:hypothetical protein
VRFQRSARASSILFGFTQKTEIFEMTITKTFLAVLPALAFAVTMSATGVAQAKTKKKTADTATTQSTASTTNTATSSKSHSKLPGYKTESEAKSACGGSTVVWHATGSKAYHTATSKYFGKTKHGAYVCEKAAMDGHLHAAKN